MMDPRNPYSLQGGPRPNLLVRILMAFFALGLFVLAVFLGAMVFLALLGLSLIAAVLFSARLWWLRRRMMAEQRRREERGEVPRRDSGETRETFYIIEGRYRRDDGKENDNQ